ncbi:DUF2946 family protein [Actimicrobium sp. CCC2.4]|uniref:DUF2946 family protein n=1 Tax=Actimicrobium sp. CCC2.4 TaxID=3048606 RepID=UPI002AC93839|nr:DUF2946 family protein [Actimicrobium sp. CCC2.4]MEB0134886.1 DUF2946 family protein [Actimicrobium sp. CCC2.4]WPX32061.1 DUF2946 family protein [Actimicrobium sp. CCC2.4]
MDDIVRKAMAKWPEVPHCYGWLALDARGHWRMRDEAAQQHKQPGDRIAHVALMGFINRNYLHDAEGRWYFQNGPQRVYVNLEATPYIARTDPQHGFVLQTGTALEHIQAAWLTGQGQLILQAGEQVAQVDDRDTAHWLGQLQINGVSVDDDALLDWLAQPAQPAALILIYRDQKIVLGRLDAAALPAHFGFVRYPQPSV